MAHKWFKGLSAGVLVLLTACGGAAPAASVAPSSSAAASSAAASSAAPASPAATSAAAPAASGVSGGNLTIVESLWGWNSLDPAALVSQIPGIYYPVYDPLFRVTADNTIEPWLATSYNVSADAKTWTFKLRSDVKFQDGTPFNSQAVKFNLLRQIDPNQHSGEGNALPSKMTIDTPDDQTVVVHLDAPYGSFPWALATTAVGMMASPTAVNAEGKQFGLKPVGTGPFKFDSQIPGQMVKYVRWSGYWRPGEPKLDSVTFRRVDSATSALATVTSGGAQIFLGARPLEAGQAKQKGLTVRVNKALGVQAILLNTTRSPFSDLNARRAVGYAINEAEISQKLYGGMFQPTESMIGPGSWAYPGKDVPGYPAYDLNKAKELVQQLGGLSFDLKAYDATEQQQLAQLLQSEFAAANMKVSITPVDPAKSIGDVFAKNYEADIFGPPGHPDPDSWVRPLINGDGKTDITGLNDPKLFSLLQQGQAETDQTQRKQTYAQAAAEMAAQVPMVYISDSPLIIVMNDAVQGFPQLPFDDYYLNTTTVKG